MAVLGSVAFVATRPDGPSTRVTADETPTTIATTSTVTTVPPEPAPPGRRRLLADRTVGWELLAVEDSPEDCLELVVGPWRQGSLLCGARPATDLLGDLIAVDTPVGRLVVTVVEPSVTGILPAVGMPGHVGPDPAAPTTVYAAGPAGTGQGGHLPEILLMSGDNTVARVLLPVKTGLIPPTEMTVVTDAPYGRWPGYRKAGYAGLFYGGNQEVGFYDGASGTTCVLYRRLGSRWEGMLAEACRSRDADRAVAYATLVPVPVPDPPQSYIVLALTDRTVTGWRCELPQGGECGRSAQVSADPGGTGWTALTQFADMVTTNGADRITVVLLRDGVEVGRADVPVPA